MYHVRYALFHTVSVGAVVEELDSVGRGALDSGSVSLDSGSITLLDSGVFPALKSVETPLELLSAQAASMAKHAVPANAARFTPCRKIFMDILVSLKCLLFKLAV